VTTYNTTLNEHNPDMEGGVGGGTAQNKKPLHDRLGIWFFLHFQHRIF
jgi:hypothetical protein